MNPTLFCPLILILSKALLAPRVLWLMSHRLEIDLSEQHLQSSTSTLHTLTCLVK